MNEDVPWDARAIRIIERIHQSLDRLGLDMDTRGEFASLLNALEFHIDACRPTQAVVDHVSAALVALAHERGIDDHKLKLSERLQGLHRQLFGAPETR